MQFHSPAQAVAVAIRAIFERWTALRLTIEHQCGGVPDKAIRLLDTTVAMATNTNVRHTEEHFIDLFYSQFDSMETDIEDGSPELVAASIVRIRDSAARGDYGPALESVTARSSGVSTSLFGGTYGEFQSQGSVGNRSSMNDSSPNSDKPMVDEDGFTEVRRKPRNR